MNNEELFKLDEEYYIGQDNYNIILIKRKKVVTETGEIINKDKRLGFFANINETLNKYINIKIKEGLNVSSDVAELLNYLKKLETNVNQKLEDCKIIKYETKYNKKS